MSRTVFVDSAYLIALAVSDDQHHRAASNLAEQLDNEHTNFVITRAIFLEIGSALSRPHLRAAACAIFDLLQKDHRVSVVELESPVLAEAQALFRRRMDKEWSLTDCISFVVMKTREITEALTTDIHFEQAGFCALLRKQ